MNDFNIASGRSSTRLHAAPGGRSTFSLAHDSGNDGKTPKELAALRKVRPIAARRARARARPRSP